MVDGATVLAVFGTRPEVIKLVPVFRALQHDPRIRLLCVSTGQQADLLPGFITDFRVSLAHDLGLMFAGQSLNDLLAHIVSGVDPLIERYTPDAVLIQGDTISALGGALTGRLRQVPVVHVEAGLRTGDPDSPFPEETCRRLISHVAALHCAPTEGNRCTLRNEGIDESAIIVTGNPVVDAVRALSVESPISSEIRAILDTIEGRRLIALTMHRRENFGPRIRGYLGIIRTFVEQNDDVCVVFPVHPNPGVQAVAQELFEGVTRIRLTRPLGYTDFIHLVTHAWLVVSDSGGVQEEVASLGKPMLIVRAVTERPEIVEAGMARLAETPQHLGEALRDARAPDAWCTQVKATQNPFGDGQSGARIAAAIADFLFERRQASAGLRT